MQKLLVEVKDNNALKILKNLEEANIIRLLPSDLSTTSDKISSRLRGSISKETARQMHREVKQMRDEWQ